MDHPPHIIALHGVDPGTGRTLAIANLAYQLVAWGRHVLLVDLDLQTQGLSALLRHHARLEPADPREHRDALDLIDRVARSPHPALAGEPETDRRAVAAWLEGLPEPDLFIRAIQPPDWPAHLQPRIGARGRMEIIALDQDPPHAARAVAPRLGDLGEEALRNIAQSLRFYLQSLRFEIAIPGLDPPAPTLSLPYDYILVDAPAGRDPISRICLGPLSDRVVFLVGPGERAIRASADLLAASGVRLRVPHGARPDDVPYDPDDPPDADDPPRLGPKPTLLVASMLPQGQLLSKRRRLATIAGALGPVAARLSYHPDLALDPILATLDEPHDALALEYAAIARAVLALCSDHPQQLGRAALRHWQEDLDSDAAIRKLLRLASCDPVAGEAHLQQIATPCPPPGAPQARPETVQLLFDAILQTGLYAEETIRNNRANALSEAAAAAAPDPEADALFELAHAEFARAVDLRRDFHEAYLNWALSLRDQARSKPPALAEALYARAREKFAAATNIAPDRHDAYHHWGDTLLEQARAKSGAEAERLFREAESRFQRAAETARDSWQSFNNWGIALSDHAALLADPEADTLFHQAFDKFAAAALLRPNAWEIRANWGNALLDQARARSGEERARLLRDAREQYAVAERIEPGSCALPDAWAAAQEGLAEEAAASLRRALVSAAPPSREGLLADPLLEPVRDSRAFRELLESWPA